jgi:hypothetical protein
MPKYPIGTWLYRPGQYMYFWQVTGHNLRYQLHVLSLSDKYEFNMELEFMAENHLEPITDEMKAELV